jgi:hypothetical protein
VAQAQPVIVFVGADPIRQVGSVAISDEEQVAQRLDLAALLAVAQQCRDRHPDKLAEQIEQRRFQRRDCVDSDAEIERLLAAPAGIAVRERAAHAVEDGMIVTDRLADDQFRGVDDGLADRLATRNLADADVAGIVRQDNDISREVWAGAPLRLSSMLSCLATGMTSIRATTGVPVRLLRFGELQYFISM